MIKIKIRKRLIFNILETLALTGAIIVASQSPYFWRSITKAYFRHRRYYNKEVLRLFRSLKYRGYIRAVSYTHLTLPTILRV